METHTAEKTGEGNALRKAYEEYISYGIADSDGCFMPMSIEAFAAFSGIDGLRLAREVAILFPNQNVKL